MNVREFSGEANLVGSRPNRNGVQQAVRGHIKDVHGAGRAIDRKSKTTVSRNSDRGQSCGGFHP